MPVTYRATFEWCRRGEPTEVDQPSREVRDAPDRRRQGLRLLVVIPALNEARTIGRVISRIPRDIPGISETRVVVIDDGSTDGTGRVAEEHGARVLRNQKTQGLGRVLRRAFDLVVEEGADVLVHVDGDGQFNSRDMRLLVEPILEGRAQFVTGIRFGPGAAPQRMGLARYLGNVGMARLISVLTGRRFYDSACGFRAYAAEVALRLNPMGSHTCSQETLLEIAFRGFSIEQRAVRVRGTRRYGRSRVAHSLLRYGYQAALIIARTYRDYRPLRFFGVVGSALAGAGIVLGGFFLRHYYLTGRFTPHLWAGFSGAFFFGTGCLLVLTGILADMLDRIRLNEEEILYQQRLQRWRERRGEAGALSESPAATVKHE